MESIESTIETLEPIPVVSTAPLRHSRWVLAIRMIVYGVLAVFVLGAAFITRFLWAVGGDGSEKVISHLSQCRDGSAIETKYLWTCTFCSGGGLNQITMTHFSPVSGKTATLADETIWMLDEPRPYPTGLQFPVSTFEDFHPLTGGNDGDSWRWNIYISPSIISREQFDIVSQCIHDDYEAIASTLRTAHDWYIDKSKQGSSLIENGINALIYGDMPIGIQSQFRMCGNDQWNHENFVNASGNIYLESEYVGDVFNGSKRIEGLVSSCQRPLVSDAGGTDAHACTCTNEAGETMAEYYRRVRRELVQNQVVEQNFEATPRIEVVSPNEGIHIALESFLTVGWVAENMADDVGIVFDMRSANGKAYRIQAIPHASTSGSFQWKMNGVGCWLDQCDTNAIRAGDRYTVRARIFTPVDACIDGEWSGARCPIGKPEAVILASDESDQSFAITPAQETR